MRRIVTLIFVIAGATLCLGLIADPMEARAAAIATTCLILWLSEAVPPFVPTLILLTATPLLLSSSGPEHSLGAVLGWMADPVLALFFGGFVLAESARAHGLDRLVAGAVTKAAAGRRRVLVALVMGGTAFLSMWMSNIAAAALMIAALQPLIGESEDKAFQRGLLVAIAFAANLGGMATPIGSGPNAIAIAALPGSLSFLQWMAFAAPLTLVMLAAAFALIIIGFRIDGCSPTPAITAAPAVTGSGRLIIGIACLTMVMWLTEPLHGIPSAVIALAMATLLFASGLLPAERLRTLDWSTLILIAGGIGFGRLLAHTGLLQLVAGGFADVQSHPLLLTAGFVVCSALLSALMSNTATATMLIPMAIALDPASPALPILVALAASFGMPFVISTPPNAMAASRGARSFDLFWIGSVLMLVGCMLLIFTGPTMLAWFRL